MFILLTLTLKSHLDSLFFLFLELLWKTEEPVCFFIYEQIIISLTTNLSCLNKVSFWLSLSGRHSGPPAPPRRTGTRKKPQSSQGRLSLYQLTVFLPPRPSPLQTGSDVHSLSMPSFTDDNTGWPQDEFVSRSSAHLTLFFSLWHTSFNMHGDGPWQDDEEGDMYEAPPCERPAVKVPQRQVQENVYLGKNTVRCGLSWKPWRGQTPDLLSKSLTWYVTSLREDVQPSCSSEAGCSSPQTGKACRDNSSECRRSVTVSSELLQSFELHSFNTDTSHPDTNQTHMPVRDSVTKMQQTGMLMKFIFCISFCVSCLFLKNESIPQMNWKP